MSSELKTLALSLCVVAVAAGCASSDYAMGDYDPDQTDFGTDTGLPPPDWQDIKGPDSSSQADSTDSTDPQCELPAGTYYLSSDDSNSMASPVLARSFLEAGLLVPPAVVRVHEFLNYYDLELPPGEADALALSMAMRPTFDPQEHELLVAVSAPALVPSARRPLSLTLSIDTSSSMDGVPLHLATSACQTLARSLQEGDILSIVTWNTSKSVLLDSWPINKAASGDGELVDAQVDLMCTQLEASGATDLHLGLVSAIELADRNAAPDRVSRIILFSDGRANAGFADVETIAERARRTTGDEVLFMGVGVGTAVTYRDSLMDIVTDAGKGAYIFLDSDAEAQKAFGPQLLRQVDIAAKAVSVAMWLPHGMGITQYHGEEFSQSPGEVEPQHLAADDTMAFHQIVGTCGEPDQELLAASVRVVVDYTDPATRQSRSVTLSKTVGELLEDRDSPSLLKANAVVAWAELLKTLPADSAAATSAIDAVRDLVHQATSALQGDSELQDIDGLLVRLRSLVD